MTGIKHEIEVVDDMTAKQREKTYQEIKNILTEIGIPVSSFKECTQMWVVQEELNKLIKFVG